MDWRREFGAPRRLAARLLSKANTTRRAFLPAFGIQAMSCFLVSIARYSVNGEPVAPQAKTAPVARSEMETSLEDRACRDILVSKSHILQAIGAVRQN